MENYQLLSGETIEYETPALEVQDFLARVREAANNPNISLNDLLSLIYGDENPLLDKTVLPGRPMVTKAVFANPVYQVMSDQIGIKRASLGLLDVQKSREYYTLDVNEVARRLGITSVSVRNAINGKKLAAVYDNGQWWIHPNSVESYKVSNRGQRRANPVLQLQMGSAAGASLAIKTNAEVIKTKKEGHIVFAYLPAGWKSAFIRVTMPGEVQVYEIEESNSKNRIQQGDLYAEGLFKLVRKATTPDEARKLWGEKEKAA